MSGEAPRLEPCCADRANRQAQPPDPARPGWYLELCGVCGRRHFTLKVREAIASSGAQALSG